MTRTVLLLLTTLAVSCWTGILMGQQTPVTTPPSQQAQPAAQPAAKPAAKRPAKPAAKTAAKPAAKPATPSAKAPAAKAPGAQAGQAPAAKAPAAKPAEAKAGQAPAAKAPAAKAPGTQAGQAPAAKAPAAKPAAKETAGKTNAAKKKQVAKAKPAVPKPPPMKPIATNLRDPFKVPPPSAAGGPGEEGSVEQLGPMPPGKRGLVISELRLEGIVRQDNTNTMIAIVAPRSNRAEFLRENDEVYHGAVTKITLDSVYFREDVRDQSGHVTSHEIVKRLPSGEKR